MKLILFQRYIIDPLNKLLAQASAKIQESFTPEFIQFLTDLGHDLLVIFVVFFVILLVVAIVSGVYFNKVRR